MQKSHHKLESSAQLKRFQLMLKHPGPETDPPPQIIQQLRQKFNKNQKDSQLNFFGGQPVSLNRTHLNAKVFKVDFYQNSKEIRPNDYLICEKTDGVRFLLIVTVFEGCNYLMSRLEGKGNRPVFYKADALKIANNYDAIDNKQMEEPRFENIVEILDGELCIDSYKNNYGEQVHKMRYLVFDILVHHKMLVTRKDLNKRLAYAQLFIKGNNFGLEYKPPIHEQDQITVEIQMKDFFEIYRDKKADPDAKAIEFLFQQYIPSLPHENDGIIFNDRRKQYLLGTNEGYLKWKPIELNSVDFLGVPNTKFEEEFDPYRVVDLYLRLYNKETNTYSDLFEAFLVVSQQQYENIQNMRSQKTEITGEYVTGVVLECNFSKQSEQIQKVYRNLYGRPQEQFYEKMMNQRTDDRQKQKMKKLKSTIFQNFWNIIRIREDRSAGNNADVAQNIMKTIKENITEEDLIKLSNRYFQNIKDIRNKAMGIKH